MTASGRCFFSVYVCGCDINTIEQSLIWSSTGWHWSFGQLKSRIMKRDDNLEHADQPFPLVRWCPAWRMWEWFLSKSSVLQIGIPSIGIHVWKRLACNNPLRVSIVISLISFTKMNHLKAMIAMYIMRWGWTILKIFILSSNKLQTDLLTCHFKFHFLRQTGTGAVYLTRNAPLATIVLLWEHIDDKVRNGSAPLQPPFPKIMVLSNLLCFELTLLVTSKVDQMR
jgi:hypothetical protein